MNNLFEYYIRIKNNTIWSRPFTDLEWKLRYAQASLTKEDLLVIAGYLSSYDVLIEMTNAQRNRVANEIKGVLDEKPI